MSERLLKLGEWWPGLFAGLSEDQRRGVVQSWAIQWHEGWEPNREDVGDLIAVELGEIDGEECRRRRLAKAKRRSLE